MSVLQVRYGSYSDAGVVTQGMLFVAEQLVRPTDNMRGLKHQ